MERRIRKCSERSRATASPKSGYVFVTNRCRLTKGSPSTLLFHILCGRPPALGGGQVSACFTEEGNAERGRGGRRGRPANEGRKRAADRARSPCPVRTAAETTCIRSHAQDHIHTAHVNTLIPSPPTPPRWEGEVKPTSPCAKNNTPCLNQTCRPLGPCREPPDSETSVECDIQADMSIEGSR